MDEIKQISLLIVQTLGAIYLFLAVMRVLLRASRADFYNPGSQIAIKATQLPVGILSKVIPSWKRLDIAGIIWVLLVHITVIEISALSLGGIIPPTLAITWALISSLNFFLEILYWGMLIIIIISIAGMLTGNIIRHPLLDLVQQVMTPILYPFQRLLPPFSGLDLSPIILFLTIHILQIITYSLAASVGVDVRLVIGF